MKTKILSVILSVVIFSQCWSNQFCAKLKAISAGESHTLALDEYGSLWACGGGEPYYQLGLGDISENVLYLQRVRGPNGIGKLNNVIVFDAGWEHSLAVLEPNGLVFAWGYDDETYGMLGNGQNEGSSNVPIKVHGLNNDPNGLRNIVKVSAGRSGLHSLAVDSSGFVYAWGYNYYGQCGDGSTEDQAYPILVLSSGEDPNNTYLGNEAFIIDVDAGVRHSLALVKLEDGGFVYEWGGNNGSPIPQKVPGEIRNIIDISTCYISLAADVNGNVWQWTTGNPTKIPRFGHIVKVAAGYDWGNSYSIGAAIDTNENVWEWTTDSNTPVKVSLENIVALDVGYYGHRVAVDEDGYGWGWGNNGNGQLGVGDTISHPEPTRMPVFEPNVWNINRGTHFTAIQDAISDSNTANNDTIVVYPGIYKEYVYLLYKWVTLRGSNPADPTTVA